MSIGELAHYTATQFRAGKWDAACFIKGGGWRGTESFGPARSGYRRLVPLDAEFATELAKRTLTNLYNQRPAWLANAHRRLDEAVLAAYGWPTDLTDDQILAKLLELNLARQPASHRFFATVHTAVSS